MKKLLFALCLLGCSPNDDGLFSSNKNDPSLGGGSSLDPTSLSSSLNCGDGLLTLDEACDDGNKQSGDGCTSGCLIVEPGYSCPTPGQACIPVARCGDGVVVFPEQCDDGANEIGDGCSATCKYETGYKCLGSPSVCEPTICGDGKIEGAETCDDGNATPFDGCSASCQGEPLCPVGSACTSVCGDGIIVNEACDDGNTIDGDGCSSDCKVENGYTCSVSDLGEMIRVPMVVRDFNEGGDFEKGGAFKKDLNYANQGLVQNTLQGIFRRPVLANTTGTYNGIIGKDSGIINKASFAMWYDSSATVVSNTLNKEFSTTLLLCLNDTGTAYVNRYGNGGDGSTCAKYEKTLTQSCISEAQVAKDSNGNVMPCYACYYDSDLSTPECNNGTIGPQACNISGKIPDRCELVNGTYIGIVVENSFDGNPSFFPADTINPYSPSGEGQISGNYDNSWPKDGKTHNFSFTTEVRNWFQYDSSKTYVLSFVGDDDVWVFVNGRLAVDIGGIHAAVSGTLTISPTGNVSKVVPTNGDTFVEYSSSPDLGLINGGVYEIVVLHAERQTTASSYQLTLSGFNSAASDCRAECGDGVVGIGEECDDGVNTGGYGKCGKNCTFDEYCGDGIVQAAEECDDGNNVDGDSCPSGCRNLVSIT